MCYDHDRAVTLVEEVAAWAVDSSEADDALNKLEPLARHFVEVSGLMVTEVLIIVAKSLQAGYYYGKHGFPEERVPDAFKDAFQEK